MSEQSMDTTHVSMTARPPSCMKTRLVNKNVNAASGRTSMRLEPEVWDAFREICLRDGVDVKELIERAVKGSSFGGRTSAVRVFLLQYFRQAATEEGHRRAGHGSAKMANPFAEASASSIRYDSP